jgi:hypothetical protein
MVAEPRAAVAQISAVIPAGQSLSSAIDLTAAGTLVRIYMPDDWTEALITMEVSADNIVPYRPMFRVDGSQVSLVVVPGGTSLLLPDFIGRGLAFFKLRSGTQAQPVNQTAARTFTLIIQP